jgi:pimeloyl-ACP methyl ester carboxylesterase
MRAGFEYFHAFPRDAEDFAGFAKTPLAMPMLVVTGEKASGTFLIDQARLVATNVQGVVIRNAGHWLMEEAPADTMAALTQFVDAPSPQ